MAERSGQRRVRLALLGDPVEHSRSPAIHRAALAAAGIEGDYEARRVERERELVAACSEIASGSLRGANVTMPWKEAVVSRCDRLSPDAVRAGAVNTLVGVDGVVHGHNTDVDGIRSGLARLPTGPVSVVGSGATAAAAVLAADGRDVTLVARRPGRAEALAARLGTTATIAAWDAGPRGGVLINATPIGMSDDPLPDDWVRRCAGLLDLPYGDAPTPSVAEARRRGLPVVDGLDVLVAQAAASFELWTGLGAPVEVMERAARGGVE